MEALIEGLPDAVALQCLGRVPLSSHPNMRAVNRAWRLCLCSKELFEVRKKIGSSEEWLYVGAHDPDKVWQAFDPNAQRWFTLPLLPTSINHLFNFGTVALDGKLYVLGGDSDEVDPVTGDRGSVIATNEMWMFDPVFRKWSAKAPMLMPRARFACCVLNGSIVVAGGSTANQRYLGTAEIYNMAEDRWERIADLCETMNYPCSGVVLDEKVFVVYKDMPSTQVYNSRENKWEVIDCMLSQGPMSVVNGDLYVLLNGIVSREHPEEASRKTICTWPSWYRRQSFGVAGLGEELYVVGGVTFPRRGNSDLEQLAEVWICKVDGERPSWRKGVSMTVLKGSVSGCAALRL